MAHEVHLRYYANKGCGTASGAELEWHMYAEGWVHTDFGSNALSLPWDVIRVHLHQRLRQRTHLQAQWHSTAGHCCSSLGNLFTERWPQYLRHQAQGVSDPQLAVMGRDESIQARQRGIGRIGHCERCRSYTMQEVQFGRIFWRVAPSPSGCGAASGAGPTGREG